MSYTLVHEDSHTLVAVKPPGMPVQKDPGRNRDFTSELTFMLRIRGTLPPDGTLHLITRLDRPVGGLVLFAKNRQAAAYYSKAVAQRQLEKHYLCVVAPVPGVPEATLTDWLKKDPKQNRSQVVDKHEGKEARLHYRVVHAGPSQALLDIHLITGRHHQIRVQMAHAGHPIQGDAKYHPRAPQGDWVALWSWTLSLIPYGQKTRLVLTAPPPLDQTPWNGFDPSDYPQP